MSPLELILLFGWSFAVSFGGGLVGLVLGNLRLPLVVAIADTPAEGAGANVAISGAAALASAIAHWRAGRLSWRLFWWMAPTSLVGAIAGGLVSGVLPSRMLLGVIGLVVLYGAYEVYGYRRPREAPIVEPSRRSLLVNAALVGLFVGFVGGIVGLILGSLRLPALVRYAGVSPYAAVGTNAAVGVVVGIGGLIGHLPSGVDWAILGVGALGAVPGAWFGSRFTGRLNEPQLLHAMAIVLLISGLSMSVEALLG